MAQNPLGPPPNVDQAHTFNRWMRLMYQRIIASGQILWSQIVEPTVVKNTFFSGPTTGADAAAAFRAIVAADLGTGTPTGAKFLRDDLSWQLPSSGATSNVISAETTIAADTSYIVIDYLNIEAAFIVEGMVEVL